MAVTSNHCDYTDHTEWEIKITWPSLAFVRESAEPHHRTDKDFQTVYQNAHLHGIDIQGRHSI